MPEDDFDSAFGEAAAEMNGSPPAPAPTEPTEPGETPPAEPTESVEPLAEAGETAPTEPAEHSETPPAEPTEPAPAEEIAPAPTGPEHAETPPEAAPAPLPDPYERLSAEDRKALEDYEADFPEIHKAESIRQQIAMERAFNAFSTELAKVLSPMLGQYGKTAEERHVNAIAQAHPDYQAITPGIMAWVDKQPPFLKQTYTQVLTDGDTRDVIDLIGAYKSLHSAAPAAQPASAPVSAAAAAALAPVAARRSDPPAGKPDENDFDSAFAEAARSLMQ